MEKVQRIRELYQELRELRRKMRPFTEPQGVGDHQEWTQEEADYYLELHQRQEEIVSELADLEGGHI